MGGAAMATPVVGAIRAGGSHEPLTIPRPTTTANLHSHHPSSSYLNIPQVSAANSTSLPFLPTSPKDSVDNNRASGSFHRFGFGPVPSRIEVEKAISDLQSFMAGLSPSGPEPGWLQRMVYLYAPRMMQSLGFRRLYDAFHLLQIDPSVKRLVVSIASDKAVWDAILNNKAVQDLLQPLSTAKEEIPWRSTEEPDLAILILNWILDIIKAKVTELIEKFSSLINEFLLPLEKGKPTSEIRSELEEKLRSSFLLAVVILLIVVVTRGN